MPFPPSRKHFCAATGCHQVISVRFLMCWPHWKKLPRALQRDIWRTSRHADRSEYNWHVDQAIQAIVEREGRTAVSV